MRSKAFRRMLPVVSAAAIATTPAMAQPVPAGDAGTLTLERAREVYKEPSYSPYAGRNFPTRPLFGDLHVHTAVSFDAGVFGARLMPEDAYRFAKGEEVVSSTGQSVKLSRPLDFLAVTDHSDNMGFFPQLLGGSPKVLADPTGRRWYEMMNSGQGAEAGLDIVRTFSQGSFPPALMVGPGDKAYRSTWQDMVETAEAHDDPGVFTALIGYEWTSQGAYNIHRNVIYRDGADKASLTEPFTTLPPAGSPLETDLWDWMAAYEAKTAGDVLAIPHNGNVSNGLMFPVIQPFTDDPVDLAYAEARARWEPLYEVTQMKGDGEAHPYLSPDDEFADYETWDQGNLTLSEAKTPEMLRHEYARSGLKLGLEMEREFGVNPFKFGMVGSTDSHTALATAEEDNFFGKVTPMEPNPERLSKTFIDDPETGLTLMEWAVASSGYAAVWATENTREAIFDAMERRETYATTGPRMIVRFFGGWDFRPGDAESRLPADAGYTRGVPMGGELTDAPEGTAPSFLVAALKDPIGANLDRIQIVKGWLDAEGETQEKVHDVVWSDAGARQPGADGRLPPVGDTVDVAEATWTNTIGDPELIAVWTDPDFDPTESAFYYARVIEIPTPRWTAYDAKRFGVEPASDVPMVTQERAYTSPIWYTPR